MEKDKTKYKVRLDEEGDYWRYNNEEDTSIFSLLVWGLITVSMISLMFWLFI